jgi:cell division cycle 14
MTSSYFERELRQRIEFLPERLYYVALSSPPPISAQIHKHFFSIDQELVYWNFYLDFGPLNLGHLNRFCRILNAKLADPLLKDKVIYFYSGTHAHKRANAAFLICSWAMLCLRKSPDDAFRPFKIANAPFPPWVS